MPTTFSTALPAIATMTRPAKDCDMCSAVSEGVSALTNQSDTKAAATLVAASTPRAAGSGQVGATNDPLRCGAISVDSTDDGTASANTTSRTPAATSESCRSWWATGTARCTDSDGTMMMATARLKSATA